MITTKRLEIRPWKPSDFEMLSEINADPDVGYWLGGPFSAAETRRQISALEAHGREHGYTFWPVEELDSGRLVGTCGLKKIGSDLPLRDGVEIGWRLARPFWGKGYAAEAANAVLELAWQKDIPEVLAFTACTNMRSRALMERIGMQREAVCDFAHPRLSPDHPLRTHVVYSIRKPS